MLLTLSTTSVTRLLVPAKGTRASLTLMDLPEYARQSLGLFGLHVTTDLLAGQSREQIVELRERADKSGCACLTLTDPTPQALGVESEEVALRSADRIERVLEACSALGCSTAVFTIEARDDDASQERVAERIREIMPVVEKRDLTLAIRPASGLTASPDRLADLIKRVGGFRLSTAPDFATAAAQPDPAAYLKRVTPYAVVVFATTLGFAGGDDAPLDESVPTHEGFQIEPLVEAVRAVGFDGTLAVDYRGKGDPTLGIIRSRQLLEHALETEVGA